ncbi:MAG TPA: hypothetical protein VFK04_11455 [Gemmatimonadaceae bacterium]|nr:hypothetical protein [Gemmatimonadaceae bacterium]
MSSSSPRRLLGDALERARAGAVVGLGIAAFYVAYVVLLYVRRGDAPFAAYGVHLSTVVLVYVGGGLTAGAIVGLFAPLSAWRLGAVLVATLGATVVFFGIATATEGPPWIWGSAEWSGVAILAVLFGLILGNFYYRKPQPVVRATDLGAGLRTVDARRDPDRKA